MSASLITCEWLSLNLIMRSTIGGAKEMVGSSKDPRPSVIQVEWRSDGVIGFQCSGSLRLRRMELSRSKPPSPLAFPAHAIDQLTISQDEGRRRVQGCSG